MVALQCTVPNAHSLYLTLDLWEVVFTSHEGQVKGGRWLLLLFFFFFAAQSIWLAFKAGGHKCHTLSLLGALTNKSSTTAHTHKSTDVVNFALICSVSLPLFDSLKETKLKARCVSCQQSGSYTALPPCLRCCLV